VKCWISQKIGSEKDSFDTRFKHVFFLCIWMGCRFAWRALRACLFLFVFCIERKYSGHLQTLYIPHLVHRDSSWNLDRYIVR
jgi:hypothetical protein